MKPKLRWKLQYQVQNSFQERSVRAFERDAQKKRDPKLYARKDEIRDIAEAWVVEIMERIAAYDQ